LAAAISFSSLGPNTTIPLILLAIVLGLLGILFVITSRKIAYVQYSLPVWNGVLLAYAFWHFDDSSWAQTRKVTGNKRGDHGDKDGGFDSSHIIMKRWEIFERDRRWRSGTQSRDSVYYENTVLSSSSVGLFELICLIVVILYHLLRTSHINNPLTQAQWTPVWTPPVTWLYGNAMTATPFSCFPLS
jgi:hypothetical protein